MLDLYGTYDAYNGSSTEREADYKALLSDWYVVGQDIFEAMTQFRCLLPPAPMPYRTRINDDKHFSDGTPVAVYDNYGDYCQYAPDSVTSM